MMCENIGIGLRPNTPASFAQSRAAPQWAGAAAGAKRDLQATAGGPRAPAAKRRAWGPRGWLYRKLRPPSAALQPDRGAPASGAAHGRDAGREPAAQAAAPASPEGFRADARRADWVRSMARERRNGGQAQCSLGRGIQPARVLLRNIDNIRMC